MTDADKKLYDKAVDDLWSIASGTPEEIDAMTTPWIAGYRKGIEEMKKTILKLRNCKNCKFGEHNGYLICAKKGIAVCSKWEMKE